MVSGLINGLRSDRGGGRSVSQEEEGTLFVFEQTWEMPNEWIQEVRGGARVNMLL